MNEIELGGFATLTGILLASIWTFLRWRSGVVTVDPNTLSEMQRLYIIERDELEKERLRSREERKYFSEKFKEMQVENADERSKCAEKITALEGRTGSLEENEKVYQQQLIHMEGEVGALREENAELKKELGEKQKELDSLVVQLSRFTDAKDC